MAEESTDIGSILSVYGSFVTMISVFLGFILATVTIVSLLQTDLLFRRLTLLALLTSFTIMDLTLVRTHANIIKQLQKFPCPRYNDELLTIAMTSMSVSISVLLLIGGLTVYEASTWFVVSVVLAYYSFSVIRKAKKTQMPTTSSTVTKANQNSEKMTSKTLLRDVFLFWSGIIVSFLLQLMYDAIREEPFYENIMPIGYWRSVLAIALGIIWVLMVYFLRRRGLKD